MCYREGAVVEAAQHLEGRGAPGGHVARLGAKPGVPPCCPTEQPATGAMEEHEDVIVALQVATCASVDSYRGEVPTQPNSVTE